MPVALTPIDDALRAHPPRRDGARRRRRGPRERGRPHDRRRVGDARGDQLHAALGPRARVHAVRRAPGSTSSTSRRWSRRARPAATPRSPCRSTTATRAAASVPPIARSRSGACSTRRPPDDFVRPGHVFPLRAREGGVLERRGHTEAAVDLARLAGLPPVAVICEVLHDDGSPARLPVPRAVRGGAPHRDDLGRAGRRVPVGPGRRPTAPPAPLLL